MAADKPPSPSGAGNGVALTAPNCIAAGRKRLALGLLWQPAKSEIALRDQARLAGGASGGFDLYANRADARQIGFASKRDGFVPGMLAGATAISCGRWGGNWLAALRLPGGDDRWWIVARRDSQIYEDRLHESEEDARRAFGLYMEAPDWDRVIAPASWGISKAGHAELSELLDLRRADRLKRVNWEVPVLAMAACAALLAAALHFGWQMWSENRSSAILDEGKQSAILSPAIPHPWDASPWVPDFVEGCLNGMDRLMILPPGWIVESLICVWSGTSAVATVRWRESGGRTSYLHAAALGVNSDGLRIEAGGKKAELSLPVRVPRSAKPQFGDSLNSSFLETVLRERFRTLGADATFARRSGRAAGGSGIRFPHLDLTIRASAGIKELGKLLSDVPGLVPEALAFRPESNVWQLTMKAYSEPIEGESHQ